MKFRSLQEVDKYEKNIRLKVGAALVKLIDKTDRPVYDLAREVSGRAEIPYSTVREMIANFKIGYSEDPRQKMYSAQCLQLSKRKYVMPNLWNERERRCLKSLIRVLKGYSLD